MAAAMPASAAVAASAAGWPSGGGGSCAVEQQQPGSAYGKLSDTTAEYLTVSVCLVFLVIINIVSLTYNI